MRHADFIIAGGGIIGCATAYYLARMGAGRVLLFERRQLAGGSSSLAAGLLTSARSSLAEIALIRETYAVIDDLQLQLGENLGLRRHGSLLIAAAAANQRMLAEQADLLHVAGVRHDWWNLAAVRTAVPWLHPPADSKALYLPDDGTIDPYLLTHAFARAAKQLGAEILTETTVLEILSNGEKVTGARTEQGVIEAPVVIDATGIWSACLAGPHGCAPPMAPVRSTYWLTAQDKRFTAHQPTVILPDSGTYTRPEGGSLLFGLRGGSTVFAPQSLPADLSSLQLSQLARGWEGLLAQSEPFAEWFPDLERIGITRYVAGLSPYTPDGRFAFGPCTRMRGLYTAAAGGSGIAAGGGIGRALAEMAAGRRVSLETRPFAPERFGLFDPHDPVFQRRCAAARDHKKNG